MIRMKNIDLKSIEEIVGKMKCEKNFNCYKSGFEILCKGKDIGLETFLECLEKNPDKCKFSLSYGKVYLCKCPLRVYIAKELKK